MFPKLYKSHRELSPIFAAAPRADPPGVPKLPRRKLTKQRNIRSPGAPTHAPFFSLSRGALPGSSPVRNCALPGRTQLYFISGHCLRRSTVARPRWTRPHRGLLSYRRGSGRTPISLSRFLPDCRRPRALCAAARPRPFVYAADWEGDSLAAGGQAGPRAVCAVWAAALSSCRFSCVGDAPVTNRERPVSAVFENSVNVRDTFTELVGIFVNGNATGNLQNYWNKN